MIRTVLIVIAAVPGRQSQGDYGAAQQDAPEIDLLHAGASLLEFAPMNFLTSSVAF